MAEFGAVFLYRLCVFNLGYKLLPTFFSRAVSNLKCNTSIEREFLFQ